MLLLICRCMSHNIFMFRFALNIPCKPNTFLSNRENAQKNLPGWPRWRRACPCFHWPTPHILPEEWRPETETHHTKTDLKHTANHRAQSPTTFLHFLTGAKRRCSGSPWGGCWSTCCSQSFSSRSLHSRARSCLWWWRIFVPRKTMKAAVSQSCGAERNQRLPVFSGQKGEISRPCSSHNATQQHLSLTMSSQGYGLDSRRLILV